MFNFMQEAQNELPENAPFVEPIEPVAPIIQHQNPPIFNFGASSPFNFSLTLTPAQLNTSYILYLQNLFQSHHLEKIHIDGLDSIMLKKVYDIFHNHIIVESINHIYLKFVALYYKITKDNVKMKEFYIKAIKRGCVCLNLSHVGEFDYTDMFTETHLKTLFLSNNMLTVVDDNICNLKNLLCLDLSYNKIKVLPDWIGSLSKLSILNLSHNELTELPEPLYELTQLQVLSLSNNQLTSVSDSITKLSLLVKLTVSNNQLITFPDNISKLSKLKQLDIAFNQLIAFPLTLCELSLLELLNISNNNIQTIPDDIGKLSTLQKLNMSCNKFSIIPDSIGDLYNLNILSIFKCPLALLPDSLCNLTELTTLHIFPNFVSFHENKKHHNLSYILAKYYQHVGNEEQMIKYYAIEINSGKYNVDIINIILKYYKKQNDSKSVIQYITHALVMDTKFVIDDDYQEYIQNITEFAPYLENFIIKLIIDKNHIGLAYFLYKKFNIRIPKFDGIIISEVISFIQHQDNKMKFSKLEDCPLCYKHAQLIPYDCFGHFYCLDCMFNYVYKTKKCPQCQIKPNKMNTKKRKHDDDDEEEEEDE